MALTIAVAGKGGVGKTTVASLVIRQFLKNGQSPILAVDADPDANLAVNVGRPKHSTVGQILDEWLKQRIDIPQGMSKQQILEMKFHQIIEERGGLDLLVMGRPEGPGCYCSANAVLRDFLERLSENYKTVMIDNEAGMEHLSRRTAGNIDLMLMVSDPSRKGLTTVSRLLELASELALPIRRKGLVISRTDKVPVELEGQIGGLTNVEFYGTVPHDDWVVQADLKEASLLDLPDNSPAVLAAKNIVEKILNNNK